MKLISSERIERAIPRLARDIQHAYRQCRSITMLVILDGAMVFASDLVKALESTHPFVKLKTIGIASYHGEEHETPSWTKFISEPVTGEHVLLVDDILDTGDTIAFATAELWKHTPASIKSCVLLERVRKDSARHADFVGFYVQEKDFVYGYGLDKDGLGRGLKDIWV